MSPVGWKDHTHPCVDCGTPVDCEGDCTDELLCESCMRFLVVETANELTALTDQDISRRERAQRGTPVGKVERRAFERDIYGDEG